MKLTKLFQTAVLCLITTITFAQAKQTFTSPKLNDAIAKHKVVAILPFRTTISYKTTPKNYSPESNKADEDKIALNMQQGMYTYLLRKGNNYTVTFQDIDRTNALLKKTGVYDKLAESLPDELCKILGVDAVIKSNYDYQRTATEAGAIVGAFFLGNSKTGSGALTMQIYNGADGELLWRFYKEMNDNLLSNANQIMERMMRKVARNFPYEK